MSFTDNEEAEAAVRQTRKKGKNSPRKGTPRPPQKERKTNS